MRHAAWLLLALTACGFSAPKGSGGDDDGGGDDVAWWDDAYGHRRRLAVTVGVVRPDKGYAGYTARLAPFDATALTGVTGSCDDLRVVVQDGERWVERPRHLLGCGTTAADLRFALPADIADGATWRDAFVYYDRKIPPAPLPADEAAVYLWWDDATTNRAAAYTRGRMDPWQATGHRESMAWDAAREYRFDTGNDAQESMRRDVDERDVLVEAEWRHTGCYDVNMQSGVCARVLIASGAGATETADHYYCTSRGQHPSCSFDDQGIYDGDIVKSDNETIALQGLDDPPPFVPNQWRKQALAVFGAGPTHLRFWDADESWAALATPPDEAAQARGEDTTNNLPMRGAAGVMMSQDIGRLRNLVIRRYVEPEPVALLLEEEQAP